MTAQIYDVVIIGAGLSGVAAAVHLQKNCPNKKYLILEGRENIGGTWDLFKYPGIRSDSDMYTFGYSFKPWRGKQTVVSAAVILQYINETIDDYQLRDKIKLQHWVEQYSFDTKNALWTIEGKNEGQKFSVQAKFVIACSGYYRYDQGYTPKFANSSSFLGQIVHPQHWPQNLDYSDKKIIVIGSGATAVTLVPSLAKKAAKVTMLQRSPSYILSIPTEDIIGAVLQKLLPIKLAYKLSRAKNVGLSMLFYELSRKKPELVKKLLRLQYQKLLGEDFDIDQHFTPHYQPWDERLCMVPNGDLFSAIRHKKADIVTASIKEFTPQGILLTTGEKLNADIIVTATGLDLVALGGAKLIVDGRELDFKQHYSYKGMMMSDVPNMVAVIGYTNASWTLKADLTLEYACRLINLMDKQGYDYCMPVKHREEPPVPLLDLQSGYIKRALERFPKAGKKAPWKVSQNYLVDLKRMRYSGLKDGYMQFYAKSERGTTKPVPHRLSE